MAERVGFYARLINTGHFSDFSTSSSWALFCHQNWHVQYLRFCHKWGGSQIHLCGGASVVLIQFLGALKVVPLINLVVRPKTGQPPD